jgi:hypothetical protein
LDAFRKYRKVLEFGEDRFGGLGLDERFWIGIVLGEIVIDSALEVDDRGKTQLRMRWRVILEKKLISQTRPAIPRPLSRYRPLRSPGQCAGKPLQRR